MTIALIMTNSDYNIGERVNHFFSKTKGIYATSLTLEKTAYLIDLVRKGNYFQSNTASRLTLNSNWEIFNSVLRCSQFFSHDFSFKINSSYENLLTIVKSLSSYFIDIVDLIKIIKYFDPSIFNHATVELLSVYSNGFAILNTLTSSLKNINKYQYEVLNSIDIEEEIKKAHDLQKGNDLNSALNKNYLLSRNLQDKALLKTFEKVIQCAALIFGFTSYFLAASLLSLMGAVMELLRIWNKIKYFPCVEDLFNENIHLLKRHDSQCLEIKNYKDNHTKLHEFLKISLASYEELSKAKRCLEEKLSTFEKWDYQKKMMKEVMCQTDVACDETFTVTAIFTPVHEI